MPENKEAILQKAYDLGFKYEKEYRGCCQCVLAAIQDSLAMDGLDAVFKSATALSGGLCGTGVGACGALIGGVMALGHKMGRERSDAKDVNAMYQAFEAGLRLHGQFIQTYGSGNCREIQEKVFGRSFDFADPHDLEAFEQAGGHVDKCPSVVANAARWTAEILLQPTLD